jgi:hypothetical protein
MNKSKRMIVGTLGALMLLFGLGCINYTKMGNFEQHSRFAEQHRLPPPSRGIVYLGMLFTSLGAALLGFAIGRRQHVSSAQTY